MGVSRETVAAIRFGYGFRPGETPPADAAALLDQLSAGPRTPPGFARDPIKKRILAVREANLVNQRKNKLPAGPERAALEDQRRAQFQAITRQFDQDVHDRVAQAVYSPHGFYERLAAFWANHFSVSINKKILQSAVAYLERDAIRPNLAGRFRDLMKAAVLHPAMLFYLDQTTSIGPNSQAGRRRGRGLNENLAREILELHALGVDGGYTQQDVTELAKLLTGMRADRKSGAALYVARAAEPGERLILGERFGVRGGPAGRAEIDRALDVIAAHPAVAPFICAKLARHFVADDPSPALVAAMAAAWRASDGDLTAVYGALLDHPESWARFGDKVKTPFDFVVSTLRAVDAPPAMVSDLGKHRANRYSVGALRRLNQAPWRASGPDGYADDNGAWLTPQGLATRIEWAALVARRVAKRQDPRTLMDLALADTARPDTRFVVEGAAERWEGVALVLASPEFNRR